MNIMSFNSSFSRDTGSRRNVLSVFNQNPVKPTEVEPWMTPDEIAEIISEKLMVIVRAQFEATRIEFEKEQAAKADQEA
jgi:hypothetical protein